MLTARITNSLGQYQDYSSELLDFSYLTSNNDGTAFTASAPKLTALVKLAAADSFLHTLVRGDTVQVTSSEPDGLTLYLSIIEVTILDRKGTTEISCTGAFFDETNDIWGALLIPEGTWEDTKLKFTLDNVEHYEDNGSFYAHVNSKLDIVMGLAWSYDTRRTVALTPFTTGDGESFSDAGVGIFKEVRETSTVDPYAPVYRIAAEDIVDYDVSPAQPPVTHIVANSLGSTGAVSSIPEIVSRTNVSQYTADNTARFASIEELQLAAVKIVNMVPSATAGAQDVYDSTVIYWSDGTQSILSKEDYAQPEDVLLVGITPVGYVLLAADGVTYTLHDKATNAVLKTHVSSHAHSSSALFTRKDSVLEHYLLAHDNKYHTVIFFNKPVVFGSGTSRQAMVGLSIADDLIVRELIMPYTTLLAQSQIDLAGSCKVIWNNKPAVSALYHNAATATSDYGLVGTSLQAVQFTTNMYNDEKAVLFSGFPSNRYYKNITDFEATYDSPTDSNPAYILSSGASGTSVFQSKRNGMDIIYRLGKQYLALPTQYPLSITLLGYSSDSLKFVVDKDKIVKSMSDFHVLSFSSSLTGTWGLVSTYRTTEYGYSLLQYGDLSSWAQSSTGTLYVERGATGLVRSVPASSERTEYAYGVALQLAPVPFVVRDGVTQLTPQMISSGSRNELRLPFRVGLIDQRDMATWDRDEGRIELDIAKFRVRDNATSQWIEKSVQALNVMAIGSYVKVWLTPEDDDDYITIKVLEYDLTYSGAVRAKVVGMIVPESTYEPPVPLPDRYVLVESLSDLTSGEYLIVYTSSEGATSGKAFKSSLSTLDAPENTIDVVIGYDEALDERYIRAYDILDDNAVTISVTQSYTESKTIAIRAANGDYITRLTDSDGIDQVSTIYQAALSAAIDSNTVANIVTQDLQMPFRYDSNALIKAFRFITQPGTQFKSVRLYKFVSAE